MNNFPEIFDDESTCDYDKEIDHQELSDTFWCLMDFISSKHGKSVADINSGMNTLINIRKCLNGSGKVVSITDSYNKTYFHSQRGLTNVDSRINIDILKIDFISIIDDLQIIFRGLIYKDKGFLDSADLLDLDKKTTTRKFQEYFNILKIKIIEKIGMTKTFHFNIDFRNTISPLDKQRKCSISSSHKKTNRLNDLNNYITYLNDNIVLTFRWKGVGFGGLSLNDIKI